MFAKGTSAILASLLIGMTWTPLQAAEREQVRIVVNLVSAAKMPYPENLPRSRAKTQRVWLDQNGFNAACLRHEDRRWCYEHIPPVGARAEMLRIRSEPAAGIVVGQLYHYVVDYDLDGMLDVGSTTKIETVRIEGRDIPIGNVIQFFHRATNRGDKFRTDYQKMYDDGIQLALKYLGE